MRCAARSRAARAVFSVPCRAHSAVRGGRARIEQLEVDLPLGEVDRVLDLVRSPRLTAPRLTPKIAAAR